ncbi:MAG: glucose-6-phosphate dehydrogenase [Chitinophagaceae bacterium]
MSTPHKIPPASVVFIFGGSGDLNIRKLTPALYNLFLDAYMPEHFAVVGLGRTVYSDVAYRAHLYEGIQSYSRRLNNGNESDWVAFSNNVHYQVFDASKEADYALLTNIVKTKEAAWGVRPKVVFYLAVAPQLVPGIAVNLGKMDLCHDTHCTRVVVEKPFGHDLESAHTLNQLLLSIFKEDQIYRIDHYLGKETVQNILALRFANALFEPIWNRNYIDHIQITNAEVVGLEGRGGYYEQSGALRDMLQNHILQLICMVAMEPPTSFDANEIRNKKVDVLNAVRKIESAHVHEYAVRGQYGAGTLHGNSIPAYRAEEGVDANSDTETFAAMKLYIDNWRWQGVPFYVRTGKRLQQKTTFITVQFKQVPHFAFPTEAADTWKPNRLIIGIQPEMDIRLRFQAKKPGQSMTLHPVDMVFNYSNDFAEEHQPEAYETLLLDVMEGNATQFMRADQIEAAWKIVMPIITAWETSCAVKFPNYTPGTWGPDEAEQLITKDGRYWINLPQGKR